MNPPSFDNLSNHFENLILLNDQEIESYLNDLNDPPLKKELQSLLKYSNPKSDFLEKSLSIPVADPVPEFSEGETVGIFVILKKIGEGSFGKVYLAHDKSLERQVALKITPHAGNEALIMAHLEHDNIVKVFSETIDTEKKIRFICMQFIRGKCLSEVLAEPKAHRNCDPTFYLQMMKDLSSAMATAHKRDVLHLDLKPENIILDETGKAYLTDFNVSRIQNGHESLLGGTTNYMSPEQQKALIECSREQFGELDGRSDVFSMGKVFEELLNHMPSSSVSKEVHAALREIIAECNTKDREKRTQSFVKLQAKLESLVAFDRMLKKLPQDNWLDKLTQTMPRGGLFLSILIPQLIGTAVNITYNSMRIVSHLTPHQQDTFLKLILAINPFIYGPATWYVFRSLGPAFRFLKDPSHVEDEKKLLKVTLFGPQYVAGVATFGWTLMLLVLPTLINYFSPPISWHIYFHFGISFFLSWLIAITYSFLNTQYFLIRQIYPKIWQIPLFLKAEGGKSLSIIESRLKLFPFLAGGAPLVGAILMVIVGADPQEAEGSWAYQGLLISFLLMGIAGLFYGIVATRKMLAVLYSFRE